LGWSDRASQILAPVRSDRVAGPVAHGVHGAERLWAACTLIRTGTRSRRKPLGPPPTSVLVVGRAAAAFGAAGRAWLARDDKLLQRHALDAIHTVSSVAIVWPVPQLAMTK